MDITLEIVEAQAMQLSPPERARLLERLIQKLDEDAEIEAAWDRVADEREAEIDSGAVQMLDGEQVLAELKAKFAT